MIDRDEAQQEQTVSCNVSNRDRLDVDLECYSDSILEDEPETAGRSLRGLKLLIALELLGIAAIGVYWLVQLL